MIAVTRQSQATVLRTYDFKLVLTYRNTIIYVKIALSPQRTVYNQSLRKVRQLTRSPVTKTSLPLHASY